MIINIYRVYMFDKVKKLLKNIKPDLSKLFHRIKIHN